MGAKDDLGRFDRFVSRLIRRKAREVSRRYGYSESDIEDLEQELWLEILLRLDSYDPRLSRLETFVNRLIKHKISNIKEYRGAAKRDYRRGFDSLDEEVEDSDGSRIPRAETIDAAECRRRSGWAGGSSETQRELDIDLKRAIDDLPPDLREVLERLRVQTVSEISIAMRMPRGSIYRKIHEISRILEARGMRDYL